VRDHHRVQVAQPGAEDAGVVSQRRAGPAAGQAGVEQQPGGAGAHQVRHAGLADQPAAVDGEPLHQRQDRHLVHLTQVPQSRLHLDRPGPVCPRHTGGVTDRQPGQRRRSPRRATGQRPLPCHRNLPAYLPPGVLIEPGSLPSRATRFYAPCHAAGS
jgi:hypothetical protein